MMQQTYSYQVRAVAAEKKSGSPDAEAACAPACSMLHHIKDW